MSMKKTINVMCSCKDFLVNKKDAYCYIIPCEHVFHVSCINKHINKSIKCPLCDTQINRIIHENIVKANYKKTKKITQNHIDLISLKHVYDYSSIDYFNLIIRMPTLTNHFIQLLNSNNEKELRYHLTQLLYNSSIKISKSGKITNDHVIFICNHISYLDPIILYFLTSCGFVGSSKMIHESPIGKKTLEILPLISINRGKNENTVNKIKEYMNKHTNRNICIFPEGMISHPDTLCEFRTGSFMVGVPIQPVIISYEPVITAHSINEFLFKLVSQNNIKVKVKFLNQENPPFNNDKIDDIRIKMASAGNLMLSRVSNRDIKE
jgi:1-acyl-sn-glycerol-3-phosphate acyltransferase